MKRQRGFFREEGGGLLRRRIIFALILLTLLAFAPVAGNDFIGLDDVHVITGHPRVRAGLTLEGVRWAFTSTEDANWFPMTRIGYLLNVEFFGIWPGGHHLTSLAIHTASAVLLLTTLSQMTGALRLSAFAAAVFAVHPLRLESVAWSTELSDVLATFFFMLALRWYTRWAASRRRRDYWTICLLFALALMSKATVVTFPLVLLLLDYWPLGRRKEGARTLIIEKMPLLALSLGTGLAAIATQRAAGAVASLTAYPLDVRLMTAALSTVGYLGKLLLPLGLSPFYVHPGTDVSHPASLAAALFIGVVTAYALTTFRTRPWLTVGWGWYLVMIAPLSGLIQTGYQGMADRFTYLSLIGVVVAGTWELYDRLARRRAGRVALAVGAAGFLAWCALLTPLQARRWRDTETLFSHALTVDPENWLAHLKLGEAARGEGRYDAALPHLERTVEINPGSAYGRTLLGVTLGQLGRGDDALRELREAVRSDPNWADGRHNLAVTLAREGQLEEAVFHLRAELLLNPRGIRPYGVLTKLLLLTGRQGEAEDLCRRWVELDPDSREARDLLRRILEARDPLSTGNPVTPEVADPAP
jgi:hypothetical protein